MRLSVTRKSFLLICSIFIFTSASNSQSKELQSCSGPKYLVPCGTLSKSDSTEYFAPGLMDHSELDAAWLKEEIKKEETKYWLAAYAKKHIEEIFASSSVTPAELEKIRNRTLKQYSDSWNSIESKISPEDKIYYYSTPREYWTSLSGQDGLAVIRNCKVVYVLTLTQS